MQLDAKVFEASNNTTPDLKSLPYQLRCDIEVTWKNFDYPFSVVKNELDGDDAFCPHGWGINENDLEELAKFSKEVHRLLDIATFFKIYFFQPGESDGDSWILVVQNFEDEFIYFNASCCYTGFGVVGGGTFTHSKNWKHFWNNCLDHEGRSLLLETLETS